MGNLTDMFSYRWGQPASDRNGDKRMVRKPLSPKSALIQIGAVAAGACGALATLHRLAGAQRARPAQLAIAAGGAESGATRPVAEGASAAPGHPHAESRPGWRRPE